MPLKPEACCPVLTWTGAMAKEGGKLIEGRDYYMEDGLFVLTAEYLLRRGYCCGNGCRHCPYEGSEKAHLEASPPPGTASRTEEGAA